MIKLPAKVSDTTLQAILDFIAARLGDRATVNGVKGGRLVAASGTITLLANSPATHVTQVGTVNHGLGIAPFAISLEAIGGSAFVSPLDVRYLSKNATSIVDVIVGSDVNITFSVAVSWVAWGYIV